MDIVLHNNDPRPIYEQIYAQIKRYIIDGTLTEGYMMPSIRTLAKELKISVITTKRAYEELEKESLIYTVAAKGSYVAHLDKDIVKKKNENKIKEHMREIISIASQSNIDNAGLCELFNDLLEDKK